MLPRTAVSAGRIAEVLETEVSIRDPEGNLAFQARRQIPETPARADAVPGGGRIEFKNVSFRYEGATENALTDVSFTVESGQTVAVIGATGSGKTTLVNLIARFYDVTEGSVTVNGADVRELSQKDLRDRLGYVPQKSVLLSGTVAFNLRYGKTDATDAEIREGAEIARIRDFIEASPEGYESAVAQGGANLSGGQKQRLSIARALVRDPEILIFDDSFSALDFATDARLRRALEEKRKNVTKIIVAQRVGTVMNADKIVVLEKGRIAGIGKHRELVETCAEYAEIAESQFSGEAAT